MIAFCLPPLTLEILEGDIAAEATDAIVNAANSEWWMGAGVAGVIERRGGRDIEELAIALGPVEPGDCVRATAGQLSARAVIRARIMIAAVRSHAAPDASLPLVRLVLFGHEAYERFADIATELAGRAG